MVKKRKLNPCVHDGWIQVDKILGGKLYQIQFVKIVVNKQLYFKIVIVIDVKIK